MIASQLTKSQTEADLDAEMHGAIRKAFPWLPADAIHHQTTFSFKFGHASIEVDGAKDREAEGRTDILIRWNETPLAVMELKRKGLALTQADIGQGLSYARVIRPRYPLVVVTNGDETRVLDAFTEKELSNGSITEQEFHETVAAASMAASEDMKNAIGTLMGSNARIWMQAVRGASSARIDELSGTWNDPQQPFVKDFLLPRKATAAVLAKLKELRFVLIEGAPLIGKSNLLREIVQRTADSAEMAVLFVAAGESGGVLRAIADLLGSALAWPITPEEARTWLMRLSKATGPSLVLAVDEVDPESDDVRRELEDLSSPSFGPQLRLVITADDAVAKRITEHPKGRQASTLGRRIEATCSLKLLDDDEFHVAERLLHRHRMIMMHGSHSAPEFRVPWVLRALGARYALRPEERPDSAAALPPQLSLDLITETRERFWSHDLRRMFRGTAKAVLEDAEATNRSIGLTLEATATFVVRHDTLKKHLPSEEIQHLVAQGYLKPLLRGPEDPVLFVRLPELLASEASFVLASELETSARKDPAAAARRLNALTSRIPLGDIIAAYAIVDAISSGDGSLPHTVLSTLVEMRPEKTAIPPGTRAAVFVPGVGVVDVTFENDGCLTAEIGGKREVLQIDPEDSQTHVISNHHPWLILSHLACIRLAAERKNGTFRLDPWLLGIVGTCPHVLRRPDGFPDTNGISAHEIPGYGDVACHVSGIVEPITYSLFKFFSAEGPQCEVWLRKVLDAGSLAMLARADIALREIEKLADKDLAEWAHRMRIEHLGPALSEAFQCSAT